jgi:hypothetical protein
MNTLSITLPSDTLIPLATTDGLHENDIVELHWTEWRYATGPPTESSELVLVRSVETNGIVVTRGARGTDARYFPQGADVRAV